MYTLLVINTWWIKKKFILEKIFNLWIKIILLDYNIEDWAKPFIYKYIKRKTKLYISVINEINIFLKLNPEIKIDWAITYWEDDVLLLSKITEYFGLIWIEYNLAKNIRNKFFFRKLCENKWILTPKSQKIKNIKDLQKIQEKMNFPIVFKPEYWASSVFIIKVENNIELNKTYEYISQNISKNIESALNDWIWIFVEEYINWQEIDIDILIQNWNILYTSITDNEKTNEPYFVEKWQSIPSILSNFDQNIIINDVNLILSKLWLTYWCFHFEGKYFDWKFFPIEINLRMGWDEVYFFSKYVWWVDLIEYSVNIALWIKISEIIKLKSPNTFLYWKYLLPNKNWSIRQIIINNKIKTENSLLEFNLFSKIWDIVKIPPEWYDSLWWFIVSWENHLNSKLNALRLIRYIKFIIN